MISIIVPVYNVAPYLSHCIDSILSQTYRDIEIILIDDGSTDDSGKICDGYGDKDNRIRVFHTENNGLSAARNVGLREASGCFIGFVDSDDFIEPEMYSRLMNRLIETGADISICGYDSVTEKINLENTLYEGMGVLKALLSEKFNNNVWNKLYRRELFMEIFFPEGRNYEDVMIMHRLAYRAKCVATFPDELYHYQIRPESITKSYTARNLLDYAEAHLSRYYFVRDYAEVILPEQHDEVMLFAANGISKVWRWWYGCNADEKAEYDGEIEELYEFAKTHFTALGCKSWPLSMRISTLFMHSRSSVSFFSLYYMNQIYRKMCPEKGNIIREII